MTLNERCPYCGSESISYVDSRLDYNNELLMETDFCICENCRKDFNIEVDYIPHTLRYYNPSTCELLREEEHQDE